MRLTSKQIETLINTKNKEKDDDKILSLDELDVLLGFTEDKNKYFDGAFLKTFSKLFRLYILMPLVGNKREEYFLENAELDTSVWFGDNLSDNLSEYKKMSTKYLKHFEIECDGSITPLVIHYQSNFPTPRFDHTKLDHLFREVFQILRFAFQNLVIASKIKEGYDASIHEDKPLLCHTFDFFSVNDTRGQILIGIPYEGFSKWKEIKYLSQDELDALLAECKENENVSEKKDDEDESDEENIKTRDEIQKRYLHISTPNKIKKVVENTYIQLKEAETKKIVKGKDDQFYKLYLEKEITTFYGVVEEYLNNSAEYSQEARSTFQKRLENFDGKYPLIVREQYGRVLKDKLKELRDSFKRFV